MIRVLSLGAGVQSTTVLLMSERGELPRLDHAIFADTGWEPAAVYRHLEWLESVATTPIHRVSKGNIREDALRSQVRGVKTDGVRWASMPYRTIDRETGKEGMIRRQCTSEYKIQPIEKKLKELCGLRPRQRVPKELLVEQWFGISIDEVSRMRTTDDKWRTFVYPLIDARKSRGDCLSWLHRNGYPTPPRSACIACPFHSNQEWREIRKNPSEWKDAIEFDRAIRNSGGMRGEMFVHRDCVALEDAEIDSAEDRGQLNLWENECEGLCGV